ncbi:PREDICTED: probable calcium-binding protein CML32 [Tarenaya hassleriana]|uniref:probable calcium-binding protein CML32 n=1 Tax=Tarenaya hassleriana TaxID=28532 RepID=UPI00053C7624|nr:PREDICTED: probable calcium-binding protein CML32 [Tarenaya hassleriana]
MRKKKQSPNLYRNINFVYKYRRSLRFLIVYNPSPSSSSSSCVLCEEKHYAYTVATMSPKELMQMFEQFDKNGDGKISGEEFRSVFRAFSPSLSAEELDKMMEEFDVDGDGYIDAVEFVTCMQRSHNADALGSPSPSPSQSQSHRDLREAFEMYDADGDGKISAMELHVVLRRLGEKCTVDDCRRMIRAVDVDGDGHVDFEEFKKMMSSSF